MNEAHATKVADRTLRVGLRLPLRNPSAGSEETFKAPRCGRSSTDRSSTSAAAKARLPAPKNAARRDVESAPSEIASNPSAATASAAAASRRRRDLRSAAISLMAGSVRPASRAWGLRSARRRKESPIEPSISPNAEAAPISGSAAPTCSSRNEPPTAPLHHVLRP